MMSDGTPFVVRLTGELDIGTKDLLRTALHAPSDASTVLLDLTTVTYADSTALAELFRYCLELERAAIPVALLVVAPQLKRIIEYAGLEETFRIFSEREAALDFLRSATR